MLARSNWRRFVSITREQARPCTIGCGVGFEHALGRRVLLWVADVYHMPGRNAVNAAHICYCRRVRANVHFLSLLVLGIGIYRRNSLRHLIQSGPAGHYGAEGDRPLCRKRYKKGRAYWVCTSTHRVVLGRTHAVVLSCCPW